MFLCFLLHLPKSTAIEPASWWMASLCHWEGSTKNLLVSIQVVLVQVKTGAEMNRLLKSFLFTMLRFACAYKGHVLQVASGFHGSPGNEVREPEFD